MAKPPLRPVAKKDDFDLTPPEEIRARRIRQFVFIGALGACFLGVTIYFVAPPLGRIIKGWQSRRLAREVFALVEQRKWAEANAKARDALLLRPTEPESWRAIARLASRTGQWPQALEWWQKVDDAHRLTIDDRRDFIGAALKTGDLTAAEKQVEPLLTQRGGPAPIDIVFAGQVAARESNPLLALDYGQRALVDKRAKPYEFLAAATLVLSVTSPYSEPYAAAWKQIEDVARDPKNPGSLDALVLLANEQAIAPMAAINDSSLTLATTGAPSPTPATEEPASAETTEAKTTAASEESPTTLTRSGGSVTLNLTGTSSSPPPGRTMSLTEIANALENHPDARPYHKLLALEVRARRDPALTEQYVADAVERFGNTSRLAQTYQGGGELADETLIALVEWLNKIGRPARTLEMLSEERAIQRQDFFLQYVNALVALQRWNVIKELTLAEHSAINPMIQHMYLALAQANLGSATAATNEWWRALQVAHTSEKLMTLATNAELYSVNDIADAAYSEAIKLAPQNRDAYAGRLRLALAAGRTSEAQKIASEISQVWPDDANARNQNEYLRLLLGASDDLVQAAERDAQVLVAKEPRNWSARATLGLARLRLGRKPEALAAVREPRVTGVEPPGALAVRAAILAANGYGDGARNDALLTSAKPLLPEERALIAPLLQ